MARCPVCGSSFDERAPHDPDDLLDELPCGSRRTYCRRRCTAIAQARRHADHRATARAAREHAVLTAHLAEIEDAGQMRLDGVA